MTGVASWAHTSGQTREVLNAFRGNSAESQDRMIAAVAVAAGGMINLSIAAAQILLALGVVLLIAFRRRISFAAVWLPILLFFSWSVLADVLSPHPFDGLPYLRKAFDFLFIPLMFGAFAPDWTRAYRVLVAWTASATFSGLLGLFQYVQKYRQAARAGQEFYLTYLDSRITGFQSHWMTFGELQLSALTLVLAHLLFAKRKMPLWAYGSSVIFLAAIYFSWDRGVWLATILALLYLIGFSRPKLLPVVAVLVVLAFVAAPSATRARMISIRHPHGDADSNRFRIVTLRTGLRMVEAHPWFGLGPSGVKREFDNYVPADVERPLPAGYYGHLHDVYVEYAAERGIPALLFLLGFIAKVLWDCARGIARMPDSPPGRLWMLHATIAVVIGVLVVGCVEHNLGDSHVLMAFVMVIGLAYAALANDRSRPAPKLHRTGFPNRSTGP
jgi:putative inorganic carbon (hco3(-)) transporter